MKENSSSSSSAIESMDRSGDCIPTDCPGGYLREVGGEEEEEGGGDEEWTRRTRERRRGKVVLSLSISYELLGVV
jgi:hypothetical protein